MSLSNTQLLTAAYPEGRPYWSQRLNSTSDKTWSDAGVVFADNRFKAERNQTFNNLVQRIMLPLWRELSTICQFERFHKGDFTNGNYMQEIGFTELLQMVEYKGLHVSNEERFGGEYDQFKPRIKQPRAAYHAINRQGFYGISLPDLFVRRAFLEQNGLSQAAANLLSLLQNSNKVDTEMYFKKMFIDFMCSNDFPMQASQVVEIPDVCMENATSENHRIAYGRMAEIQLLSQRNNSAYNPIGRPNVAMNNILMLDLRASIWNKYNNLSILFNKEESAIPAPEILLIDNFGVDNLKGKKEIADNIIGIMAQEETFAKFKGYEDVEPARDAVGKFTNEFLHIIEMYRASPFFNLIVFVRNKDKFLKSIRIAQPEGISCTPQDDKEAIDNDFADTRKKSK